jgi:hypothetical protein
MVASINVDCHVQGNYGPFLPAVCNPDGTQVKRRKWQLLEGVIVESQGEKKWLVRCNGGIEKECPSVGLKLLFDPRYRSCATSSLIAAVAPIEPQAPLPIAAAASVEQQAPLPIAAAAPIEPQAPLPIAAAASVEQQAPLPIAAAAPVEPQAPLPIAAAASVEPQAPLPIAAVLPIVQQDVEEISLAVHESMDPEDVDVDEMGEDILEGHQEEDIGFDVVENITSDVIN